MPTSTGLAGEYLPPGTALATRPPVVRPDQVTTPSLDTDDSTVLDRLLSDIATAVDRLDEPECGPAGREVGRWLRTRAQEAKLHRTGPAPCDCTCAYCDGDDDW
jgi:hypothetical protein